MLTATEPGIPAGTRTRLLVEPRRPVGLSVLPLEDPARAQEVSLESGIPEAGLRGDGAGVRPTHRRAGERGLRLPGGADARVRRQLSGAGLLPPAPEPAHAAPHRGGPP